MTGEDRRHYRTGEPAWVDLRVTDAPAAAEFYTALFGWEIVREPLGADHYNTCLLGGEPVAGIASSVRPGEAIGWTTYFAVDDIEASGRTVAALGGVPGPIRRFREAGLAMASEDAQHAIFGLYQAGPRPGITVLNSPGALCWNELNTSDPRGAEEFYRTLFGYVVEPADSATGAGYSLLLVDGSPAAGVLALEADWPTLLPARWLTYFAVSDLERSLAQVLALGGKVMLAPLTTDYGEFCVVRDPWRAVFCLARVDHPLRAQPVPPPAADEQEAAT